MSATPMPRNLAQLPARFRFVLVNNRMPRAKVPCTLCGTEIEQSYVRELHTGLLYCDAQCFAGCQRIKIHRSKAS